MTTVTTKLCPSSSDVKSARSVNRFTGSSSSSSSSQSPSKRNGKESGNNSGSYKLKNTNVILIQSDQPHTTTTSSKSSDNPTKLGWKNSKILSRTISSIEVIRAMKNKSSSSSTTISGPTVNPSLNSSQPNQSTTNTLSTPISSESTAFTSSSLINPIPSSALAVNQSSSKSPTNSDDGSSSNARRKKAVKDWKNLKTKLTSLRKKSNPDNSDVDIDSRRLSPSSKGNSTKTSRSGSQDEGIVCRREDLIQLLYEAARMATKKPAKIEEPNLCPSSPSSSSQQLASKSVLTKATVDSTSVINDNSIKGNKKSALKMGNINAASIDCKPETEEKTNFVETKIVVPPLKSALKQQDHNVEKVKSNRPRKSTRESKGQPIRTTFKEAIKKSDEDEMENSKQFDGSNSVVTIVMEQNDDENCSLNTCSNKGNINISQTEKVNNDDDVNSDKERKKDEDENSVAPVKWDESNVVDAMMLGDAIQAFLRGMGSSSPPPTEKRVLFKRNS